MLGCVEEKEVEAPLTRVVRNVTRFSRLEFVKEGLSELGVSGDDVNGGNMDESKQRKGVVA